MCLGLRLTVEMEKKGERQDEDTDRRLQDADAAGDLSGDRRRCGQLGIQLHG